MGKKKTEQEESLEKKLWKTADKLRKNIDAAQYKHVVLGLGHIRQKLVEYECIVMLPKILFFNTGILAYGFYEEAKNNANVKYCSLIHLN